MLSPTKSATGFVFWGGAFALGIYLVGSALAERSLSTLSVLE
jgi:hypothetical protein